jgi:hypothetical protein
MSEPNTTPAPYEVAVVQDYDLGARECDRHFSGKNLVWNTARRFIQALRDHQFETVLVGDLAMFLHDYRRLTSVVEIIVTKEGLDFIRSNCPTLGVCLPFPVANFVRDIKSQVKIRLHLTGMPRNRKPPHVFLPAPGGCSTEIEGFPVIQLIPLIEMRLATSLDDDSSHSEAVDVIELIRVLRLNKDLMDKLHPLVQEKYLEYWTCLNVPPPKYIRPLRAPGCLESMDDPDAILEKCGFAKELRAAMIRDGLILERRPSGRAMLTTTNYDLAEKYDMHLEDEYFRIDEY